MTISENNNYDEGVYNFDNFEDMKYEIMVTLEEVSKDIKLADDLDELQAALKASRLDFMSVKKM